MRTPIVVDGRSSVPLHRQIYEAWRTGILAGRFKGGDRVPSTRELADGLGVSRTTVTTAYEHLLAEGYFDAAHGSGTFVRRDLPDQQVIRSAGSARPLRADAVRLSRYGSRLRPPPVRTPPPPGVIDLSKAGPDLDAFPFDLWRRLLTRRLRDGVSDVAGRFDDPRGLAALRKAIAGYLARSRAVRCDAEQIVVVNGSQQALDLCLRVLVDPGDEIALEDPGYPGARHLAQAHGARILGVPIDSDGAVAAALTTRTRLVCVTPSHQFPTGISMSLARRFEFLEWAGRTGSVVIEDDYDSEYRYSGPPLPALQGLADGAPVLYVGTFSNVMFPGLRLGYIVVPAALAPAFAAAKFVADRHTPILEQSALADFLEQGHLERHVRRMRRLYRTRRDALIDALQRHFGDAATIRGDAAGMHTLVRFDEADILSRAERNRVGLLSAAPYYLSGRAPHEVIISFSAVGERTLRHGIKRLASPTA